MPQPTPTKSEIWWGYLQLISGGIDVTTRGVMATGGTAGELLAAHQITQGAVDARRLHMQPG